MFQGHLEDDWSDRLGGMVLTLAFTRINQLITIQIGRILYQAALASVMNALYSERLLIYALELHDDKYV